MIAILNFTNLPLTKEQRQQIVNSIVEQADKQFIVEYPRSRVYEIPQRATAQATLDAVPLTGAEWRTFAVIPFILPGAFGGELLRLVNEARGYEWPVVRVRGEQ
jgi:hypothetical protein